MVGLIWIFFLIFWSTFIKNFLLLARLIVSMKKMFFFDKNHKWQKYSTSKIEILKKNHPEMKFFKKLQIFKVDDFCHFWFFYKTILLGYKKHPRKLSQKFAVGFNQKWQKIPNYNEKMMNFLIFKPNLHTLKSKFFLSFLVFFENNFFF